MSTAKTRFIGSGITFPIELSSKGRPEFVSDTELIRSSISMIAYWAKGRRFFNQSFGSRIHEIIEEPDDSVAKSLLRFFVKEALEDWEKRIEVTEVEIFNKETTKVDLKIFYQIRNTKIEETFIFPFYKEIIY